MMMKITISTYARSSMGVILMSSYTSFSPLSMEPDIPGPSAILFGEQRDEFVHEHAIVGGDGLDAGVQPVVAEQCWDGDREARNRGRQSGRDAGGDGIHI